MASKAKFRDFGINSVPRHPYAWKNPESQYRNPEDRRSSICEYLKNKIASEEKESEDYEKLEREVDKFNARKYGYVPILISRQREEIHYLKTLYGKMCTLE